MAYRRILCDIKPFSAYHQTYFSMKRRIRIRLNRQNTPLKYADYAYFMGNIRLYAKFSDCSLFSVTKIQSNSLETSDFFAVLRNICGVVNFELFLILFQPSDESFTFQSSQGIFLAP